MNCLAPGLFMITCLFNKVDRIVNLWIVFRSRVYQNIGTSQGLRGCIRKLKIGRRPVELHVNKDDWVLNTRGVSECGESPCKASPCANEGKCVLITPETYRCECGPHYVGEFCEKPIEPCRSNPCKHGSTCKPLNSEAYICECPPGRTGSRCEMGKLNF
jgi:agrin